MLGWGGLFLVSHGLGGLVDFLDSTGTGTNAVFVPTAANRLEEPHFVDELRGDLTVAGLRVTDLDIENEPFGDVFDVDVIVVGGGDPFFLLECAHRAGLGEAARKVVGRGGVYVGVSAGASIAGPDLTPLTLTSPFEPQPGQDLAGLALPGAPVVLPHDDRPGRHRKNKKAIKTYRDQWDVVAITDGQAVKVVDGVASVHGA